MTKEHEPLSKAVLAEEGEGKGQLLQSLFQTPLRMTLWTLYATRICFVCLTLDRLNLRKATGHEN